MKNKKLLIISVFVLFLFFWFLAGLNKKDIVLKYKLFVSILNNDTICFFGDSHIARNNWGESLSNNKIYTLGIGRLTTGKAIKQMPCVIKTKPKMIFIELGINDLRGGVKGYEIIMNYNKLIKTLKKTTPNICIIGIFPICEDSVINLLANNANIIKINKDLKTLAINENVSFINLHNNLVTNDLVFNNALSSDGLHLNDKGYKVFINVVSNFINYN